MALTGTGFHAKVLKIIQELASESLPPAFYAFQLRKQMDKLYVKAAHPDLRVRFETMLPSHPRAFQDFDAAWKATHALILYGRGGSPALITILEQGIKKGAALVLKSLADLVGEEHLRQTVDQMDAMAKEASRMLADARKEEPWYNTGGDHEQHKRKHPSDQGEAFTPRRGRGRGNPFPNRGGRGSFGRGRGGGRGGGGRGFPPVIDED